MSRIVVPGKDPVTFADCDLTVYQRIGNLIYKASKNPADFQDFRANTADRLVEAGVPDASIEGLQFYVMKDDPALLNLVVPEVKDRSQFGSDADFNAYLVQIATVTIRACKR
ncbi:hypothetical protein [Dongia sp.]|uniref:hypothetical protein n=1 Tax=Dongia sp. TaxID=1977262 RepID=UPI00374FF7DA